MSASQGTLSASPRAIEQRRALRRQAIVGLLMLPLSLLPFIAYLQLTDQGRLLWDRMRVGITRPTLPVMPPADLAWAKANAPRYDGGVALLVFHGIGSGSDGESDLTLPPERFGEQLAMLRAAGMNTVTASDVAAAFAGDRELPPNAVMISFDDGRSDAMMFADPMLADAGMRATMFVITDAASEPGIYYESWDGLRSFASTGRWDLQSHSAGSHHEQDVPGNGPPLPALTSRGYGESIEAFTERVDDDLVRASDELAAHGFGRPVAFAYPFGAHATGYDDRTNDPRVGAILGEAVASTYSIAFDQDEQDAWTLATCADDPLHLHRLEVEPWSGRELLTRISEAAASFEAPGCAS